jgi:polysaccharide biosynthesis PFTS motif protein
MLNTNALYTVKKLIRSICEHEYTKANNESKKQVFNNIKVADLAFYNGQRDTSYLLTSFAFNRAVASYYASGSNFVFPLDKEWQNIFIEYGIEINQNACSFLWESYKVILIIKSFISYFKFLFTSVLEKLKHSKKVNSKNNNFINVYFYDISDRNLPSLNNDILEKNIVTWYKKNIINDNKINVIHNVKNFNHINDFNLDYAFTYSKNLFFKPLIFAELKNLFWWINLLLKNIINPSFTLSLLVNFNEILKAKRVDDLNSDLELNAVVFNNSIGSIKPLWAVVLERSDVRIDYCFYACNAEPVDIEGNLPIDGFWAIATWENYYVVDQYQKNQLENQLMHKFTRIIFETIPWWADVSTSIPLTNKKTISLFDTILHNNLYIPASINQCGWYKSEVAILYLQTILEVARELDIIVLYKIKRIRNKKIRNKEHWDYIQRALAEYRENIILINDKISAERLIQGTDITVSKPLSTTAIIAKNIKKPSIFFDPTRMISSSDPALRSIPILSNKAGLKSYIIKTLATRK